MDVKTKFPNVKAWTQKNFLRPAIKTNQTVNSEDFEFQILDIQLYQPKWNNQCKSVRRPYNPNANAWPIPPVILSGVNAQGNSVCAVVPGFRPYIWVQVPEDWDQSRVNYFFDQVVDPDLRSKVYIKHEPKAWIPTYGFVNQTKFSYIKFDFDDDDTRKKVVQQLWLPFTDQALGLKDHIFTPIEYQINWQLQFFERIGLDASGWCRLPANQYKFLTGVAQHSVSQINICVDYSVIQPSKEIIVPPVIAASYDIEVYRGANDGNFPSASVPGDKVIQIATVFRRMGEEDTCYACVFCLDSVTPPAADDRFEVVTFATEKELLLGWQKMWLNAEADFLTGWNIFGFDMPYLMTRAIYNQAAGFFQLGKIIGMESSIKDTSFESRAYASSKWKLTPMPGIQLVDMYVEIKRGFKLVDNRLNTAAAYFLGEQKKDVDYMQIQAYQTAGPDERLLVARYCWWDAMLPMLIMFHNKVKKVESLIVLSRVTQVPIDYLVLRGQGIRVMAQFIRDAHKAGYVVTEPPNHKSNQDTKRKFDKEESDYLKKAKEYGMKIKKKKVEISYQGATVIDPERGFYKDPIPTLDFAAMYPSIMIAHNLCYTTMVLESKYLNLPGVTYETTEITNPFDGKTMVNTFVQNVPGLLPSLLRRLLAERNQAKKDMAAATDPNLKSLYNLRQLTLKVCANSMYGFTGAEVGQLPAKRIAQNVTYFGREQLQTTRNYIRNNYPNAVILYGDTDSVMVNFNLTGPDSFKETFVLAPRVAAEISKLFDAPCKLEFEKIYCPLLLTDPKNYAGKLWTKPDKPDYNDTKGFRYVKRDTCKLVRSTCKKVEAFILDSNIPGAVAHIQSVFNKIHADEIPFEDYIITMQLSRDMDSYDQEAAHVILAKRMRARDPNRAPSTGDRIRYVAIDCQDIKLELKTSERIEDVEYAQAHKLKVDRHWYIKCQLQQPLLKQLRYILKNPEELLNRAIAKQARIQSNIIDITSMTRKSSSLLPSVTPPVPSESNPEEQLPSWLKLYENQAKKEAKQSTIFQSLKIGVKAPTQPKPQPPKAKRPPLVKQASIMSFIKKT